LYGCWAAYKTAASEYPDRKTGLSSAMNINKHDQRESREKKAQVTGLAN
jgi:hypothetical protein